MIEAYPLQWPMGWKRAPDNDRSRGPDRMPPGRVRQQLSNELRLMGAKDVVISSNVMIRNDGMPYANQKAPEDPGVVLYFKRNGQNISLPCDRWSTVDANLNAIRLTVQAMRGIDRWGTEQMVDRAFTGYAELPESVIIAPPPTDKRPHRDWWVVLGVDKYANVLDVKAAYRELLKVSHPDAGGSESDLMEVRQAYEEWKEWPNS